MRNVSHKSCRKNQNTHFVFSDFFFFENRAVYEIMWKNIVERGRAQMAIWHMRIACWIPKATNTHSEYVIHIAVPLQHWLHVRALTLRHTYSTVHWLCCSVFQFSSHQPISVAELGRSVYHVTSCMSSCLQNLCF
jgi:hypothetical protein